VRLWVVAVSAALVVATGLAAGGARSTRSAAPVASPCTPAALSAAFGGALGLRSLDGWGCVGDFAYVYATVGTTPNLISVTEVLRFDPVTATWAFISRATYCTPHALPGLVYRRGCFSN
jgi:hypothetical protein